MKEPATDIIVDPEITSVTIDIAFEQWRNQVPRYERLRRYYLGDQDFSEMHEGNSRVVSNHCAYITDVLVGYQFGNEPRYTTDENDQPGQEILDLMKAQDKWAVDQEIGEDMSIYGRTYELVYLPEGKDEPNSVEIDPLHAFVAYSGDIERDSVFGAVVYGYTTNERKARYRIYLYDTEAVSVWETDAKGSAPRTWTMVSSPVPHGFGRVPLIEYRNNRLMLGDFEGIMDLQDAYNGVLSDRQDNQDSFAQAMLTLSGGQIIGTTTDEINEGRKNLRKMKVLQLDEDVVAQYLVKPSNEADCEVLQSRIGNDLHKFAMVPDLSDEKFAGNASGVAMMYKLFGTDQVVSRKQSMMQRGFTRRCKLYDYRLNNPSMSPGYEPRADIDSMVITFNLNAPQDLSYIATALTQLTGGGKVMSLQTARTLVSVIPDPEKETELVEAEEDASAQRTRETYDYDATEERNRQLRSEDNDAEENAGTEE